MRQVPLVLAVDDEAAVLRMIRLALTTEGFDVVTASDGAQGLRLAAEKAPDIVLLDIVMPKMSGVDVMRRLRAESDVPVILLTALGSERDRVAGLESGADDYIVKPVSPEELGARVRAVLRRTGERSEDGVVRGRGIEVHLDQRLVLRHGRPLPLTRREWQILRELAVRRGRPVPAKQLLADVFGDEYGGDEEFLAVWLARLRRKLETEPPGPAVIERTDDGYRFVVDSRGA